MGRLVSLFFLFVFAFSAVLAYNDTIVYVSIHVPSSGYVVIHEEISVTDVDLDGSLTLNDALYLTHEKFFEGGAAAGYRSKKGQWGVALEKLWGIENGGSYSYYNNDRMGFGLSDEVKDGDRLRASVWADPKTSEYYSYFNIETAKVQSGGTLILNASYQTYDQSWAPTWSPLTNCEIKINGQSTNIVTDDEGFASIPLTEDGKKIITASCNDVVICPPLCAAYVGDFTKLKENACYMIVCHDNGCGVEARRNVSNWIGQTNECTNYYCDNKTGALSTWSLCNSTGKANRICMGGKCIEKGNDKDDSSSKNNGAYVDVKLKEKVNVADIDPAEIVDYLKVLCNISGDEITIGWETDDDGYVIRIIVYVDDESTADVIVSVLTDLDKGANCSYGILCDTDSVEVHVNPWNDDDTLSGSSRNIATVSFFIILAIMALLV